MAANKVSAFLRQFYPYKEETISVIERGLSEKNGIPAESLLNYEMGKEFKEIEPFLADEQLLEHHQFEIPIPDYGALEDAEEFSLSFKTGTLLDKYLLTKNDHICVVDDCILTFNVERLREYISELEYLSDDFVLYDANKFFVCEHCGSLERKENEYRVYVRGCIKESWCQECAESNSFECSECGCRYSEEDYNSYTTYNGYVICEDCYESDYFTCERCGEIFHLDDRCVVDDEYYCSDCYDAMHLGDVRNYHHNPELFFHHIDGEDTKRYIGCEIETEDIHRDSNTYQERIECTKKHGDDEFYIYQMRDGSLDDTGIECITQPMSKKFFDKFNFEGWMKDLVELGARSHDTSDCGLHVHLSREWFGSTIDMQETIAGIVIDIMGKLKPQLQTFSRRKNTQWCHYPDEAEFNSSKIEAINKAKEERFYTNYKKEIKKVGKKCYGRYECLNTTNNNTYEFRIFRGTLNPITFRASVELCIRLVSYAKHKYRMNNTRYSWENFKTFKKMPKVLAEYIVLRN